MLDLVRRERRRLRRKFIKKLATRCYHTVDYWLDGEYIVAGSPLWVAMLLCMVDERAPVALLLGVGLLVSVPWWIFITVIFVQVYARWSDKYYMHITRQKLSREYRS